MTLPVNLLVFGDTPDWLAFVKSSVVCFSIGGFFAWTDICPEKAINHYEDSFNNMGMKNIESYEITKNVLNALDKDTINETKNKIIKDETPFYLKRIMKDFIGVKDTGIYNTLQDGRTKYNFKIFQKV